MVDYSPVNRPVTLGELSLVFGMTTTRMERLLERHQIPPACRIGRVRVYGPRQIQRVWSVLQGASAATA